MLRIEIQEKPEATNFILEGKLKGPWAMELERCWQAVASAEQAKPVVVNLTAVTFIDAQGKGLLARMRGHGARLVAVGLMPCALIEEIEQEGSPEASSKQEEKWK